MAQHEPVRTSDRSAQPGKDAAATGDAPDGPAGAAAAGEAPRRGKPDPVSRSFVVELTGADAVADQISGRVQHLATLDGGNFTSAETLVAIMRRVLDRARRDGEG